MRIHRCLAKRLWAAALLAAAASAWAAPDAVPAAGEPLAVAQIASGVFVHTPPVADWAPENGGDVANLGFIVGSRCVAVIDTGGTVGVGRRWKAAIERATRVPICYVINTHVHPDHLMGNAAFRSSAAPGGPEILAHAKLASSLAARERYIVQALQRDFNLPPAEQTIAYPTRGIEGSVDLDLGGRTITLTAWATAHTDNDLTVLDRSTRTLFLGDLLFAGHLPVLDGKLRGWLSAMDELRRQDVAIAVPGHGAVSSTWPAALDAQRRYLDALLTETKAAIAAGATIQQAVDKVGTEAAKPWLLADLFHKRNVTTAYAELEWE
jgi:quinoprotein relay system zinc metallohydrolase 2